MDEALLLQELKKASPKAVREWYDAFYQKMYQFVSRKAVTPADAEELTQDIFLSCLKSLPLFRGESKIWTWMLTVAQHEVADYYRKRYAKKFILALPLSEFLPVENVNHPDEISQQVIAVLQRMKHEHREILLMKYLDRKRVSEISAETGRSIKSIESILFRARDEFKEIYLAEAR